MNRAPLLSSVGPATAERRHLPTDRRMIGTVSHRRASVRRLFSEVSTVLEPPFLTASRTAKAALSTLSYTAGYESVPKIIHSFNSPQNMIAKKTEKETGLN